MSDDLISRSALLEDFRNTITEQSDIMDWLNMIARQPTAYDVDKVVEQLEESAFIPSDRIGVSELKIIMEEKAIEIVKAGGVNE